MGGKVSSHKTSANYAQWILFATQRTVKQLWTTWRLPCGFTRGDLVHKTICYNLY